MVLLMEGIGIDCFKDADQYGYVDTQLTHLHDGFRSWKHT